MATQSKKAHANPPLDLAQLLGRVGQLAPHMRLGNIKMLQGGFAVVEGAARKRTEPLEVAVQCELGDNTVLADIHFDLLDKPEFLSGAAVSVSARFAALYSFAKLDAAKEDLLLFARINGLYNAWPHWREFAQSATLRMQLPAVVIPLLTAQQAAAWAAETQRKVQKRPPANAAS